MLSIYKVIIKIVVLIILLVIAFFINLELSEIPIGIRLPIGWFSGYSPFGWIVPGPSYVFEGLPFSVVVTCFGDGGGDLASMHYNYLGFILNYLILILSFLLIYRLIKRIKRGRSPKRSGWEAIYGKDS